uniref:NADH-ubiquinone oxidoreductase chain 4 n=1 Tax=Callista chinensis TaxID=990943 RepID=A0A889QIP7_9BIVA|nr:NADH dehydrogenase subunit 4 [Callista chinensis]QRE83911.1 NADH dehydrogenase subunit 4 [Callista chinensis]
MNWMSWFGIILTLYLISCFGFGWGNWCVVACGFSVVMLLLESDYLNYYLVSEWFGMDQLSVLMVVLCFIVLSISLIGSCKDLKLNKDYSDRSGESMVELVILISLGSMVFFCLSTWMDFYFFFEFSLIPTFWLILSWGYQPERLQAGLYMIMYTVAASLPLLIGLVAFWFWVGSDNMLLSKCLSLALITKKSSWVWLCISLGFMVKLPVYFFHGWLPKAHVEAPLSGSMILAGVLLKFGAYGIIRIFWMTQLPMTEVMVMVLAFGVWGGVMSSCVCICQSDLKSLIAYSSIGHMAVSLGGILTMYSLGKTAAVCVLFAHGLCSPCLFALAASVYDVVGTRNVVLSKGILRVFPMFSVVWLMACILNMGFPPSLNFFGELFCVAPMMWLNMWFLIPGGLMVFLSACYCLSLYSWVNHGVMSEMIHPISGISVRYLYMGGYISIVLIGSFLMLDFFFV